MLLIVVTVTVMWRRGKFPRQKYCDGGNEGQKAAHLYTSNPTITWREHEKSFLGGSRGTCGKHDVNLGYIANSKTA